MLTLPKEAYAQACPDAAAAPPVIQPLSAAVKGSEEALKAAIKAMKQAVKLMHKKMDIQGSIALSGASTAASESSATAARTIVKALGTRESMKVQNAKRLEGARIAQNKKITARHCVEQQQAQSKDESQLVNLAASKALDKQDIDNANNVRGLTNVRSKGEQYREYETTFANPAAEGAPVGAVQGPLTDTDKDMGPLLGSITIRQGSQPALNRIKESINPTEVNKMALPEYGRSTGQKKYLRIEARKLKKAFVNSILNKVIANRLPSSNTGDEQLEMWLRVLGDNAPQALVDYFTQNKVDQVSEAEKRELERISSVAYQTMLDNRELSQGAASWVQINMMKKIIEKEYNGLKEDERRNILLSLQYADMI